MLRIWEKKISGGIVLIFRNMQKWKKKKKSLCSDLEEAG